MNLYENGQKIILNYFSQVIAHTNAMAHTLLHGIEYLLDSTQLAAESSWIRVDLAASSRRTTFLGLSYLYCMYPFDQVFTISENLLSEQAEILSFDLWKILKRSVFFWGVTRD